jgi:hypothetical protein
MSFTYDLTTDVGKVRLLIPDRAEATAVFDDAEIEGFLAIESGVRRAAALALETIASDTAATLRVTKTLGLEVDGTRASAELLKRAASLRAQANDADAADGGLFDIAEFAIPPFGTREVLANDLLRTGL